MKNIKEKSHEIGWVHSKHYDPIVCKQEWCEMAARESANYVLEQITEAIRLCDNDRKTDLYKSLWNCIEQLRK